MKIVISLGGSLVVPDKLKAENFKKYADVLKKISREHQLIVVVGGGKIARDYQEVAREFFANNTLQDDLGIFVTRLNANLLIAALGDVAYPLIPSYGEVKQFLGQKILVYGGWKPGWSTDFGAAWLAKEINADLIINATNVSGVFTADPNVDKSAKRIPKLSYAEYLEKFGQEWKPSMHIPLDTPAARLLAETKIPCIVIDGRDPEEIAKAIEKKHSGTLIE